MTRRIGLLSSLTLLCFGFLWLASRAEAAACYEMSGGVGVVCDARPGPAPFSTPKPFADSILDDIRYARIADYANVYSQPGGAVVRNVGDGFLYATIYSGANANGQLWYAINSGEWVRAEDLTFVDMSHFTGVEVNVQPERPFGWVLQEVQPSDAPDAEPNPDYRKLERYTFFQVYGAAVGEDNWIWYDIGGRWIRQTYVAIVDLNAPPADVGPNEFWVEVDLYEQTFAAYEGARMVYAGLVSSGLNRWPTYEGLYQVWSRRELGKMSGAEGKVDYYFIEDVPHTMFFNVDIALHGAYWHDRFGYKHSHGCVNMPPRAAEWVYYWSENAPNDLWVWVHTSDPHHYFDKFSAESGG